MWLQPPELSCLSEDEEERERPGLSLCDQDRLGLGCRLPAELLAELEILENITSCAKVENYLMLSEYEQNLSKEQVKQPDEKRI